MEDDSKEKKSGREVGNCIKGSRMRKPVPPPDDELLPECLHGTPSKMQFGGVQLRSSAEVSRFQLKSGYSDFFLFVVLK